MMRYIVVIWFCLLSMLYSCLLYAEDANAQQYQDSNSENSTCDAEYTCQAYLFT